MKNRTVLLYMTFVFLSNFSTILYFLTVYLEFVGLSMVSISSMMIAYQVSKFILEVPTGYIADRFGRKTSGLVGVVGMLGYYAALLLVRSPLLLVGAFALKGFAVACVSGSIEAIYIDSVSQDQLVRLNVVERFVFYASYAISACVGGSLKVPAKGPMAFGFRAVVTIASSRFCGVTAPIGPARLVAAFTELLYPAAPGAGAASKAWRLLGSAR